jgi:hypothetical protein
VKAPFTPAEIGEEDVPPPVKVTVASVESRPSVRKIQPVEVDGKVVEAGVVATDTEVSASIVTLNLLPAAYEALGCVLIE